MRALARDARQPAARRRSSTRSERLRAVFRDLVARHARRSSRAVYASDASDAEKRARKAAAFAAMRAGYERAKAGEPGLAGYDRWFAGDGGAGPNNASIASVALYTGQVPAFRALLARGGRRPAAVLRAGEGARRAAQGRARRGARRALAAPAGAPRRAPIGGLADALTAAAARCVAAGGYALIDKRNAL